MTISSRAIMREQYVGDTLQKDWPVGFPFLRGEDLGVILTDPAGGEKRLICGADYTVTRAAEQAGGTVHVEVPSGWGLTIFPDQPFTQETDFRNNGILDAEVLEYSLDKLTLMCLQLKERQGRSMQLAEGDARTPEELRESLLGAREIALAAAADAAGKAENAALHLAVAAEKAKDAERAALRAGEDAALAKEWAGRAVEYASGTGMAAPGAAGLVPSGGRAGMYYRVNATGTAYEFGELPSASGAHYNTPGSLGLMSFASDRDFVSNNKATTPSQVSGRLEQLEAKLDLRFVALEGKEEAEEVTAYALTASGAWTAPSDGRVAVTLVGAGGGGGAKSGSGVQNAGGGGAGEIHTFVEYVAKGETFAAVVGAPNGGQTGFMQRTASGGAAGAVSGKGMDGYTLVPAVFGLSLPTGTGGNGSNNGAQYAYTTKYGGGTGFGAGGGGCISSSTSCSANAGNGTPGLILIYFQPVVLKESKDA